MVGQKTKEMEIGVSHPVMEFCVLGETMQVRIICNSGIT